MATRPGSACTTGGRYTIREDMSRIKLRLNLQQHRQQQQVHPRGALNESIRLVVLPVFGLCDHELLEETHLDRSQPEAVGEGGHRST